MTAAAKLALVCYSALLLFPVRYHAASTGLDPSWAVALNLFHDRGVVFGRDVAFTYGPLGYLIMPMPIGANLERGIGFLLTAWAGFIAAMAWFVFRRKAPLLRVFLFSLCAIPGSLVIHEFGYGAPDLFIEFTMLFLLAGSVEGSLLLYAAAALIAVLLAFVKLSTGISALCAALAFPLATLAFDRRRALSSAAIAASVPLIFAGAFLWYEPSFRSMIRYLRAGFEIASGNSSAMSLPGGTRELWPGVGILGCYAFLVAALYFARERTFAIAFAGMGPLFMEFKHSYVREAGHLELLFTFAPLLIGIVLFFGDFRPRRTWPAAAFIVLLGVFWWAQEYRSSFWDAMIGQHGGIGNARELATTPFQRLKESLARRSASNLEADRLPPGMLTRIAGHSVSIFPWEAAYAAANRIDYRPLPVFQTDNAYTAYLDQWVADRLSDAGRAPDFIIFDWASIDGRHPLLDTPAAFLALFRQYEFDQGFGEKLLLRRRKSALSPAMRRVGSEDVRAGQGIECPPGNHPMIAKVFLRTTTMGAMRDFFFRMPALHIVLAGDGGASICARVPPKVLSNGVPLNFVPADVEGLRALLETGSVNIPLKALVIPREASEVYREPIHVEIFELPGIDLKFQGSPTAGLAKRKGLGEIRTAAIEMFNGEGAAGLGPREVVDVSDWRGFFDVTGWVLPPPGVPSVSVYLELDGRLIPTGAPKERFDIAMQFSDPRALRSGFACSIPTWNLGRSVHSIRLKILTSDGLYFYDGAQTIHFRISG